MATHSVFLKTPWTEEPGELQSVESQSFGYDIVTKTTDTQPV